MEFGLIGYPLTHSFSKKYLTGKFRRENVNAGFENFELRSINELPDLINLHPGLKGLAVTSPYKRAVIPFLSGADETVRATGSCNCIKISDKKLFGYNTDVTGFSKSIVPLLKPGIKALILGTGGAAEAVAFSLKRFSIPFLFVSRRKSRQALSYPELNGDHFHSYELIINCTPLGTFPNVKEAPPIPYDLLHPGNRLYDLVYNPAKSMFLQLGEERGAAIKNGLEMLELQADENQRIWMNE